MNKSNWGGLDSDQLQFALKEMLKRSSIKSWVVIASNQISSILNDKAFPKGVIMNTDPSNKPGWTLVGKLVPPLPYFQLSIFLLQRQTLGLLILL